MNFQKRMIVVFSMLILTSSVVFGVIYYNTVKNNYINTEKQNISTAADNYAQQFNYTLEQMQEVIQTVLSDQRALDALKVLARLKEGTKDEKYYFLTAKNTLHACLNRDYFKKNYNRVVLFLQNGEVVSGTNYEYNPVDEEMSIEDIEWLEKLEGKRGEYVCLGMHEDDWNHEKKSMVISVVKQVLGDNLGYLEVQKRVDELDELFVPSESKWSLYVFREKDQIYSSAKSNGKDVELAQKVLKNVAAIEKGGFYQVDDRLNVLGYLYLGGINDKYRDSGMAGILDLILALQWVNKNIINFGGDPNNITIMGESGGGVKISILLAMKEAKGLFHKAIVESGSAPIGLKSKEEGTLQAKRFLDKLHISTDELERLKTIPVAKLLEAMKAAELEGALDFMPVADGRYLEPHRGYVPPEGAGKIPLLVGASEDEMAAFIQADVLASIKREEIKKYLKDTNIIGPLYFPMECKLDGVIDEFERLSVKDQTPGHLLTKIISNISFLGGGAYYQAIKKAEQEAPVYCYFFTKDIAHPGKREDKYAWHTADLPLQMRIVLYSEYEMLSRKMAHAWASFAREGQPSVEGVQWKTFTQEERWTMVIDDIWEMKQNPWEKCIEILRGAESRI